MLNILIPTIPERKESFGELMTEIFLQISNANAFQEVEILFDDTRCGQVTTGEKRNLLLLRAVHKYIWFADDDDMIMDGAIAAILEAAKTDCDVMGINGIMTTDGNNPKKFYHALGNPYAADYSTGEEIYLRYPNHINPMKRSIASQIKFPSQNYFEDKAFADALKDSGLLETETTIEIPLYHYRYSPFNKSYNV